MSVLELASPGRISISLEDNLQVVTRLSRGILKNSDDGIFTHEGASIIFPGIVGTAFSESPNETSDFSLEILNSLYIRISIYLANEVFLGIVYKLDVDGQQRVTTLKFEFGDLDETKTTETSHLGRAKQCGRDGLFPALSVLSYLVGFLQL